MEFVLIVTLLALPVLLAQELRGSTQAIVPPRSTPDSSTPIHLSISAFQDGLRCARTINLALEGAAAPERVSFGILQARPESEPDCVQTFKDKYLEKLCAKLGQVDSQFQTDCATQVLAQITFKVIAPEEGKGPGHQRGMMNSMINFDREDKFCMQTDSHMDFLQNWDTLVIDDWMNTHNEFAVLTAYVMDMSSKGKYAMNMMVDCCGWMVDGDGVPRGNGCGDVPRKNKPVLTMNWAAGFSFHRCHAEQNVPVDPNLEWIFTGEEVDRAARLWTSGYDLYLPTRGFVLHDYSHPNQGFWRYQGTDQAGKATSSRTKLAELLGMYGKTSTEDSHTGHYFTLGNQRSLAQWNSFIEPAFNVGTKYCTRDVNLRRQPVSDLAALADSVSSPGATHEL